MRSLYVISLVLLLATVTQCNGDEETGTMDRHAGRQVEPTHSLEILDERQERVVARVRVALAQTDQERNAGLMDVREMPFDTGMYFLFDDEEPRSFWMANTPLSLDILFADRNHRIVRIHTRTVPFSERQIRSELPAKYTLEVNAGFVGEHDIREGMYIHLGEPLEQ